MTLQRDEGYGRKIRGALSVAAIFRAALTEILRPGSSSSSPSVLWGYPVLSVISDELSNAASIPRGHARQGGF